MANLFGKNKLKSVAQAIDTDDVIAFIDIVKKWHHDYHQGTLKQDKETSREQEYNQNFFKDILGYKEKPSTPFNFEPKATTEKGQLPDAVVGYTDKTNDIKNISAVVELKGAAIDLDRPQQREGNMSPVQQAFKYKTQYRNCPFVVVSNFWEFRLYRDNLLDYEAWTLDDLVNPDDDYLLFKTWYVLLKSDNFITPKGTSKTEGILSDIRIEQENISKKFYKVYKEARLVLLRDIYSRNETVREDIDMGVEKAQKIIDRIVFTCFAEDRGLLPDNTLQRVIRDAEQSSFGVSLWQAFKGLFEAIDSGSNKLEIPDGYNGGLFKHDEILDNLRISDDGLKPVVELSKYDFSEDLSVSILGHIFEQSISDLEEIKNKVNVDKNIEAIITQSRRKKDGIFYTPDYIVRYIVDNSLGTYLREHEEVFKEEYKLHGDINDKNYSKREKQAYQKYQYFLQNVKVVDPACGSGAFLVYVFDYLMSENQRVGDILGNNIFSTDEYIRDILKNNIYGVDLNEESVEITKLSLWLKSAQKGKKLTSLDNNIKCGNSLIDDPAVAGNKAFNWQKQFPDIFKNGGFDIVVGNPPYFNVQTFGANSRDVDYIQKKYAAIWQDKSDILFYFFYLAMQISKGSICFITSNAYLFSDKAQKLRNVIIQDGRLKMIVNFEKYQVFADASITSCISVFHKDRSTARAIVLTDKQYESNMVSDYISNLNNSFEIKLEINNVFALVDGTISKINQKIDGDYPILRNLVKIGKGMETAANDVYLFDTYPSQFPSEFIKKRMIGENINRYSYIGADNYLLYFEDVEKFEDLPNSIQTQLLENKKVLLQRATVRNEGRTWWRYSRPMHREFYKYDKIWCSYRSKTNEFILDDTGEYIGLTNTTVIFDTNHDINFRYLLALLNSKVLCFRYKSIGKQTGSGVFEYFENGVGKLPIVVADSKEQYEVAELAEAIMEKNNMLLVENNKFKKLILNEFSFKKFPNALNGWWNLNFEEFILVMKIKLSLNQKDELLQLFNKYQSLLTELDRKIKSIDYEIDQIVYKLYKLTPEEIITIEED